MKAGNNFWSQLKSSAYSQLVKRMIATTKFEKYGIVKTLVLNKHQLRSEWIIFIIFCFLSSGPFVVPESQPVFFFFRKFLSGRRCIELREIKKT